MIKNDHVIPRALQDFIKSGQKVNENTSPEILKMFAEMKQHRDNIKKSKNNSQLTNGS